MASYKVAAGIHHQDGKKYKKGEVVESAQDLTVLFPEKFTKLEEAGAGAKTAKVKGWDDEDNEGSEGEEHRGDEHKSKTLPKPAHRTMRDK